MTVATSNGGYEFTQTQNEIFSKVSGSMMFVSLAIIASGVLLFIPSFGLIRGRAAHRELIIFVVLGGALIVMGVHLYRAVQHFRRIATTSGQDIDNLMVAMSELAAVYALQRWLWIAIILTFGVGLLGTTGVF